MKIYGWNRSLALCLLCILCVHSMLLPARVLAAEGDWMDMGTDGILTLRSQQAADGGAASLQFTLLVNVDNPQSVSVDFVQDGKLKAKVVESFWHADTGELNVYLAGSGSLFDNGQTNLTLGRVTATDNSGNPVQIELRIDGDSLSYVEGTELVQVEDLTVPAEPVVLNASSSGSSGTGSQSGNGTGSGSTGAGSESGGSNASGTGTGSDSGGGNASSTGTVAETGNAGTAAGQGAGSTAGSGSSGTGGTSGRPSGQTTVSDVAEAGHVNAERDLHTRLQTVLNTAEKLQEGDYTSESYQALKEAIEWAEALLNAPDASREDVEDAILAVENAMGALVWASDVPIEPVSTNSTPKEESAGGGFQMILVIVIIAAAALGIGGIVSVQIRDKRNLL